eukprot:TRINITY_DN20552_c0_g1_i1.p1 TRINITY_DN20552_c0_g1~~TRINITY_DN20552_c0_g1_i1.p1  ORF type:complete len:155 (+),score=43.71 TRINITY_DN20552_c0_g1_i1:70-534(+)
MLSIARRACGFTCRLTTTTYSPAVPMRTMGFWSNFLGKNEREHRRKIIEEGDLLPGDAEYEAMYRNLPPSQLSLETGVPDQLIDDPLLHITIMKYNRLKEQFSLDSEEKERQFIEGYNISAGVTSLEAVFPDEVPHHTFDELPIVKEPEDEAGR